MQTQSFSKPMNSINFCIFIIILNPIRTHHFLFITNTFTEEDKQLMSLIKNHTMLVMIPNVKDCFNE